MSRRDGNCSLYSLLERNKQLQHLRLRYFDLEEYSWSVILQLLEHDFKGLRTLHLQLISEDYHRVLFAGQDSLIITDKEVMSDRLRQAVDCMEILDDDPDGGPVNRYHMYKDDSQYSSESE